MGGVRSDVRGALLLVLTGLLTACPQQARVSSVLVTPASMTLLLGASGEFGAVVEGVGDPDQDVTWTSSDESVARIGADGVATAVGVGSATLTATSTFDNESSGEAVLTVVASEPNDTPEQALEIPVPFDSPQLELSEGDIDWYGFSLGETALLSVDINAAVLGSSLDARVAVFSGDERIAANDDAEGADPHLEVTLTAGDYTLAVTGAFDEGYSGAHEERGYYFLSVFTSPPPDALVRPDHADLKVVVNTESEASFRLTNTGGSVLEYSVQDGPPGFTPSEPSRYAPSRWRERLDRRQSKAGRRSSAKPLDLSPILSDPVGDTFAPGPDIVTLSAELHEDTLSFQIIATQSSFDAGDFLALLELDLDQNPFSGNERVSACEHQLIGAEAYLVASPFGATLYDSDFLPVADYPTFTVDDSGIVFSLPLDELGDDGNLDLVASAGTYLEDSDCAPDNGSVTVGTAATPVDPVTVASSSGRLAPGESTDLVVTVDADNLSERDIAWELLITTNSALTPRLRVGMDISFVGPGEPNDSPAEASAVVLDYTSPPLSLTPGDVDWFTFDLETKALFVADLDSDPDMFFDSLMLLFDDALELVSVHDSFEDAYIETVLGAGTYLLVVTGYPDYDVRGDHSENGGYRLKLGASSVPTGAVSGQILTPYTPVTPESLGIPAGASFVAGQALVKFRHELSISTLGDPELRSEKRVGTDVRLLSSGAAKADVRADSSAAQATLDLIARLRAREDVVYAEPNYLRWAKEVPNDPLYTQQWHYGLIGLEEAWDLSTGSAAVRVAVLDTGVAAGHPDLACGRSLPGYDFVDDDNTPEDEGPFVATSFHGTHVQGTVGACSDNAKGVTGVDWSASLIAVRVLGPFGGSDADVARGILWAAGLEVPGTASNPNKADIINLSLGGPGFSQTLQDAVSAAADAGTVVVAAAGNESDDASAYSPAGLNDVITVGAVAPGGDLAWYSNYGSALSVVAPGGALSEVPEANVLSTIRDDEGDFGYAYYAGTSMAAPHVAGIVALMKAVKPDLDPVYAAAYLQNTANPVAGDCELLGCGAGLVDAAAAVAAAANDMAIGAVLTAPRELDLGLSATSGTLQIENVGDAATTFVLTSDHPAVTISSAGDVLEPGASTFINVTLDRSAFDDGGFSTALILDYSDKTLSVPVLFRVGSGASDLGELSVELYKFSGENTTLYDRSVRPYENGSYTYAFDELAAGDYVVYAYDEDYMNDGFAFFELDEGQTLDGIDIQLEVLFSDEERLQEIIPGRQGRP